MSRIKVTREIDKSTRHEVFKDSFKFDSICFSIIGFIIAIGAAASIIFLEVVGVILGVSLAFPVFAGRISVRTTYSDDEKNILQRRGSVMGVLHGFSIFIFEFGLSLLIFSLVNKKMLWIVSISFLCIGLFILFEILIKKKFLKIYNSIKEKSFLEDGQYDINKFIKSEALIGNLKFTNVIVGDFDRSRYNKNDNNIYITSADSKDKETFILALSKCFQQAANIVNGSLHRLDEFKSSDIEVTEENLFGE